MAARGGDATKTEEGSVPEGTDPSPVSSEVRDVARDTDKTPHTAAATTVVDTAAAAATTTAAATAVVVDSTVAATAATAAAVRATTNPRLDFEDSSSSDDSSLDGERSVDAAADSTQIQVAHGTGAGGAGAGATTQSTFALQHLLLVGVPAVQTFPSSTLTLMQATPLGWGKHMSIKLRLCGDAALHVHTIRLTHQGTSMDVWMVSGDRPNPVRVITISMCGFNTAEGSPVLAEKIILQFTKPVDLVACISGKWPWVGVEGMVTFQTGQLPSSPFDPRHLATTPRKPPANMLSMLHVLRANMRIMSRDLLGPSSTSTVFTMCPVVLGTNRMRNITGARNIRDVNAAFTERGTGSILTSNTSLGGITRLFMPILLRTGDGAFNFQFCLTSTPATVAWLRKNLMTVFLAVRRNMAVGSVEIVDESALSLPMSSHAAEDSTLSLHCTTFSQSRPMFTWAAQNNNMRRAVFSLELVLRKGAGPLTAPIDVLFSATTLTLSERRLSTIKSGPSMFEHTVVQRIKWSDKEGDVSEVTGALTQMGQNVAVMCDPDSL